jgi:hypothetical protein
LSDDQEKRSPVLEVKDGGAPTRKTLELLRGTFLDPKGSNFMGSGLDAAEWFATATIMRYDRWHGTQTREERRRRMGFIVRLCAEQKRLEEEDLSATALSLSLVEDLIEGDWNSVKMWIETLKFREERGEYRSLQAKRFAKFVEIAQEAFDTRPKVFCPVCVRPAPAEYVGSFHDGRHVCPWCQIVHDDEGNWAEKTKANLSPVPDEKP